MHTCGKQYNLQHCCFTLVTWKSKGCKSLMLTLSFVLLFLLAANILNWFNKLFWNFLIIYYIWAFVSLRIKIGHLFSPHEGLCLQKYASIFTFGVNIRGLFASWKGIIQGWERKVNSLSALAWSCKLIIIPRNILDN